MGPAPFQASATDLDGGVRLLTIQGELDLSTASKLEGPLEAAVEAADAAVNLLRDEDGLTRAGRQIREALEPRLRETAYTLACEVVAAETDHGQAILRMLEFVGAELRLERLVIAAIERGTRARYQRLA